VQILVSNMSRKTCSVIYGLGVDCEDDESEMNDEEKENAAERVPAINDWVIPSLTSLRSYYQACPVCKNKAHEWMISAYLLHSSSLVIITSNLNNQIVDLDNI
jgi:hypothetical protein